MCSCGKDKCEYAKMEADQLHREYNQDIQEINTQLSKLENERKKYNFNSTNAQNSLNQNPGSPNQLKEQWQTTLEINYKAEQDITLIINDVQKQKDKLTKNYEYNHKQLVNSCPDNLVNKKIRETI